MGLTPAQMDRFLDEHFRFELADDVEGVVSTLAEDVTHDVIGWPAGPSRGHDAARRFYEALYRDLADSTVESRWRRHGDGFMVDESYWKGIARGRPFGLEGRNRPIEFRMLHFIEFDEAGKMTREQVWIDLAAIQRQLPQ